MIRKTLTMDDGMEFELVVRDKEAALKLVAWFIEETGKKREQLTLDHRRKIADAAYVAATALGEAAQSKAYAEVMAAR